MHAGSAYKQYEPRPSCCLPQPLLQRRHGSQAKGEWRSDLPHQSFLKGYILCSAHFAFMGGAAREVLVGIMMLGLGMMLAMTLIGERGEIGVTYTCIYSALLSWEDPYSLSPH